MYPSALTNVMEDWVGPAFQRATGYRFLGEPGGSLAIANLIKDRIKFPDVLVSSDPSADVALSGRPNGRYVSWWVNFGRSQLVLAWNPGSVFAPSFTQAKEQLVTPESVLELPGLRLCRADPNLDPEGYQALFAFQLDQARTGEAGLERAVLGPEGATGQVFPQETLGARLQSGACDAGIFYEVEALSHALAFLNLSPQINLGDPAQSGAYARASYRTADGLRVVGAPITFTITIPSTTIDGTGAVAFVAFLLGPIGQRLLTEQGMAPIPATAGGDAHRVPARLAALLPGPGAPPEAAPSPDTGGGGNAPSP